MQGFLLGFGKRVSHSPGRPQILYVAQDDLVLLILLPSTTKYWVTDLCHHTPFWMQVFSLVDFRTLIAEVIFLGAIAEGQCCFY